MPWWSSELSVQPGHLENVGKNKCGHANLFFPQPCSQPNITVCSTSYSKFPLLCDFPIKHFHTGRDSRYTVKIYQASLVLEITLTILRQRWRWWGPLGRNDHTCRGMRTFAKTTKFLQKVCQLQQAGNMKAGLTIWPASMILSAAGSPALCISTIFCVSVAFVNTCKRSSRNSEWLFDVISRASRCDWSIAI